MKILCDSCRTKYSIADEKVRGRIFKIRCKKCNNMIVVRGTDLGEAPAGAAPRAAAAPGAGSAPKADPVFGSEPKAAFDFGSEPKAAFDFSSEPKAAPTPRLAATGRTGARAAAGDAFAADATDPNMPAPEAGGGAGRGFAAASMPDPFARSAVPDEQSGAPATAPSAAPAGDDPFASLGAGGDPFASSQDAFATVFDTSRVEGGGLDFSAFGDGGAREEPTAISAGTVPVWYLAIHRQQVGPMTEAELRDRIAAGEATGTTYCWREGMGDWVKLRGVPEFAGVVAGAAPAQPFAPAAAPAPAPAPFAAAQAEVHPQATVLEYPSPFQVGGAAQLAGGNGAPAAGPFQPAASPFAAAAPAAPAKLTAQRNESSVLFSLDKLREIAVQPRQAAAPSPTPEPSPIATSPGFAPGGAAPGGILNVRGMAGGLASSPATDLPPIGATIAAPVIAAPAGGMPRWVLPVVIGMGGVVILLGGLVVYALLFRAPVQQAAAPTPVAPGLTAPGATAQGPVAPLSAAPGPAAPAVPAAPSVAPAQPAAPAQAAQAAQATASAETAPAPREPPARAPDRGGRAGGADDRRERRRDERERRAAAPAPPPAAPPPPAAEPARAPEPPRPATRRSSGDELDALLEGAVGDRGGRARPARAAPEAPAPARAPEPAGDLPAQLSRSQIQRGMVGVKPRVDQCFNQYHIPGTVMVGVTIDGSGKVTSATSTGKFAGTPTGTCVERAVKGASLPRFSGPAMSLTYPYVLK